MTGYTILMIVVAVITFLAAFRARDNGFARSRSNNVIGGVCGGIADKFNIAPWLVRVLAVVLLLGSAGGLAIVAYLILWGVVPEGGN